MQVKEKVFGRRAENLFSTNFLRRAKESGNVALDKFGRVWYTFCMEKSFDVGIVGGGPAGLSAAIYAARSGVTVAVIEALYTGGVASTTPTVENYPGFASIDGFTLAQKMHEHAQACGAQIVYAKAEKIEDGEKKRVMLSSGETLVCGALVLALGNEPRKLGVAGEAALLGAGVSYCATCDGNFFRGRRVAVAGGGTNAVSAAEYLVPLAEKVYMIHGGKIPDVEGTEKMEHTEIIALSGNPLQSLTLSCAGKTRDLGVDGLFVSLGYKPAVELVRELVRTDEYGYILCDEKMQTSKEGIFAAGDARSKPLRQIVTAASDGAIAGQFAAVYARRHR